MLSGWSQQFMCHARPARASDTVWSLLQISDTWRHCSIFGNGGTLPPPRNIILDLSKMLTGKKSMEPKNAMELKYQNFLVEIKDGSDFSYPDRFYHIDISFYRPIFRHHIRYNSLSCLITCICHLSKHKDFSLKFSVLFSFISFWPKSFGWASCGPEGP